MEERDNHKMDKTEEINFTLHIVELNIKSLEEDWNEISEIEQYSFSLNWSSQISEFRDYLTPIYQNDEMDEAQVERYLAIKAYLEKSQAMLEERKLVNLKTRRLTEEDIRRFRNP